MRKTLTVTMMGGLLVFPSLSFARDFGVLVLPIHEGKWTASPLYEYLKVDDDFDTRGRANFTSHVSGAQFSYGITDQIAVAIKGGVFIDPQDDAQGSQWQSRAGYLYGLDLYNEVFPATGLFPGLQISAGATGFQVPFDRLNSNGLVTLIDQKMSGVEIHGAVLGTLKIGILEPYAGLRGFGSSVYWRDNDPAPGDPDEITGHAHGNISVVVGLPVQITKDLRFQAEGVFINETMVTAGFTVASF